MYCSSFCFFLWREAALLFADPCRVCVSVGAVETGAGGAAAEPREEANDSYFTLPRLFPGEQQKWRKQYVLYSLLRKYNIGTINVKSSV